MVETIEGVVRDDEGLLEIPVEGSRYLKQASVDEILEMHEEGWCGGYATDRIAPYKDKDPDLEKFFWFVGKADLEPILKPTPPAEKQSARMPSEREPDGWMLFVPSESEELENGYAKSSFAPLPSVVLFR